MNRIVENFITTIALTFEVFPNRLKSQVHCTTPECRSPRTLTRYNQPEDKQALGDAHSQSVSFPNPLTGSDIALPRAPPDQQQDPKPQQSFMSQCHSPHAEGGRQATLQG